MANQDVKLASVSEQLTNDANYIDELKGYAIRGLKRMYIPQQQMFVFRFAKNEESVKAEGMSRRYTAITLIGLADYDEQTANEILHGHTRQAICERLQSDIEQVDNIGDVALSLWAANLNQVNNRQKMIQRLIEMKPHQIAYPTVELSWVLDALCREQDETSKSMAKEVAKRLLSAQDPASGVFPHVIGSESGMRSHISCFADAVYPIHALSSYHSVTGDDRALKAANQCALLICNAQGDEGQWWWHYDARGGRVVEGYPVYSVHQDSMGPMALLALKAAGGTDHRKAIEKGLEWLRWSKEINATLLDPKSDLIWRKVARKEPNKLTRMLQAIACRANESLRFPFLDIIFPPKAIDYENRPYHLGWILYAWNTKHSDAWNN